jgi:hypothetical protein
MPWPLYFSSHSEEYVPAPGFTYQLMALASQEENEGWLPERHQLSYVSKVTITPRAVPFYGYDDGGRPRRRHEDLQSILVHAKPILESCLALHTLYIEPSWKDFTRQRLFEPLQAHRELVIAAANTYSRVSHNGFTNCVTVEGLDWPITTQIYSSTDGYSLHIKHTVNVGTILTYETTGYDRSWYSEGSMVRSLERPIAEQFGVNMIPRIGRPIITEFVLHGSTYQHLGTIQYAIQQKFERDELVLGGSSVVANT